MTAVGLHPIPLCRLSDRIRRSGQYYNCSLCASCCLMTWYGRSPPDAERLASWSSWLSSV